MLEGFKTQGKDIFTKRWQNDLCILNLPLYDNKNLLKQIESFTGEMTVKDVIQKYPETSFIIPQLNMTKNKVILFNNIDKDYLNLKLKEIGLYTSAQPFYFPACNYNGDQITDGGIRECCPVISTTTAIKSKLNIDYKNMDVFVLGVGNSVDSMDYGTDDYEKVNKWNAVDWIKFIVGDITNSNISMSKLNGEQMGFNSFTWYNPIQTQGSLDDYTTTDYILNECSMYKEDFIEKFNKFLYN